MTLRATRDTAAEESVPAGHATAPESRSVPAQAPAAHAPVISAPYAPPPAAPRRPKPRQIPEFPGKVPLIAAAGFLLLGSLFFLAVGQEPFATFLSMFMGSFGDGYSFSETLVKTAPILLCAAAAALPARLGLISVGGEGQFYFGAMSGTAFVLAAPSVPAYAMMPAILIASAAGGAAWALLPAFFKARMNVNETITTLLLNYVAIFFVNFLVFGPWKDPNNLGWPATVNFPDAAKLPSFFGTRAHVGLALGLVAALALHTLTARTRWGTCLRLLRSNRRVAEGIGLSYGNQAVLVVCLGGMLAGIAGICETSAIQGRLQSGISNGAGFSGFLVAWMAGQHFLRIIPLSLLLGALLASGDSLQLFSGLPSSASLVLQGLLFACVLAAGGLAARKGGTHA